MHLEIRNQGVIASGMENSIHMSFTDIFAFGTHRMMVGAKKMAIQREERSANTNAHARMNNPN